MLDICDIHSHILPGIDDGCGSAEESVAVLKQMWQEGVRKVFATPHFYYTRESVEDFLKHRQESENRLRAALEKENHPVPAFCCGAEVAYFSGMDRCEELSTLCLGQSRYLLLELPFTPWSGQMVRDVSNLCLQGFVPILAHYERYTRYQSKQMLSAMLESEPLVQMNASCFLGTWKGMKARAALRRGQVHLLGSDCHGLDRRPFQLGQAIQELKKKNLNAALSQVAALSNEIFADAIMARNQLDE